MSEGFIKMTLVESEGGLCANIASQTPENIRMVRDWCNHLLGEKDAVKERDALRRKLKVWIRRKLRLEYAYRGYTEEEISTLIDDPDFPDLSGERPA